MPKYWFGEKSEHELSTCRFSLQDLARQVLALEILDFAVIKGYRTDEEQHECFTSDPPSSRLDAGDPAAKHNKKPAEAFDAVPYIEGCLSWNKLHCCVLAGIILAVAKKLGYEIRWGGNWDMDSEPITDQDFNDLVHFEEVA